MSWVRLGERGVEVRLGFVPNRLSVRFNGPKRAVAVAKGRAWTEWSQNINIAEGKQKMFKIAKQMKEERKDVIGARYVKDEHGNIKVEEADIMQRWKRHFSELLNEENQFELENHIKVEGPILGVTEKEVEEALQKMIRGKAPGPSGVTADLLKYGMWEKLEYES